MQYVAQQYSPGFKKPWPWLFVYFIIYAAICSTHSWCVGTSQRLHWMLELGNQLGIAQCKRYLLNLNHSHLSSHLSIISFLLSVNCSNFSLICGGLRTDKYGVTTMFQQTLKPLLLRYFSQSYYNRIRWVDMIFMIMFFTHIVYVLICASPFPISLGLCTGWCGVPTSSDA